MKKGLILVLFAVALLISGCSDTGTLKIINWDAYDGWFTINDGSLTWLDAGYFWEKDYELSTSIFGEEEKKVSVEYGGEYVFTQSVNKTVKPGSETKVEFETDAGEIIIWNDSNSFYINEVYISPSSDPTWGFNDLIGTVGPNQWVSWYVQPGTWDIKVVDNYGDEFTSLNNLISIEQTMTFYYDGFKKSGDAAAEKLANSKKYDTITKDKVQQNDK